MDREDAVRRIPQGDVIKDAHMDQAVPMNTDVPSASQPDSENKIKKYRPIGRILRFFALIFSMVVGAIHFNDCPAQKMLPSGLVIFGGLLMVSDLLYYVFDYRRTVKGEAIKNFSLCFSLLVILFSIAQFGMFIALCYWSYSTTPTTKPEDYDLQKYCDNSVYKTSICLCIFRLLPFGVRILLICCLVCQRILSKILSIIQNIEALY